MTSREVADAVPVEVPPCVAELSDAELEHVVAGKKRGGSRGMGSNANRGWYGAGYGDSRGYDMYGHHLG